MLTRMTGAFWRSGAVTITLAFLLCACGRQVSQADLDALAEDMSKRLDQTRKEMAKAHTDLKERLRRAEERLRQVEERQQREAQAPRTTVGDEIRTKNLVAEEATVGVLKIGGLGLYDSKGVLRGNLGIAQDNVTLALRDSKGAVRAGLAVLSQDDTAGLVLYDSSRRQVVSLMGARGGGGSLAMSPDNTRVAGEGTKIALDAWPHAPGAPTTTSIALSVMRSGRPAVLIGWVEGAAGAQRAAFGSVIAYDLYRVGTIVGQIPQGK